MSLNLWITCAARQPWRPPPAWGRALLGALVVVAAPAAVAADVKAPLEKVQPKVVRPVVVTTPALYLRADGGAGKGTAKNTPVAITTPALYLHADPKARKP